MSADMSIADTPHADCYPMSDEWLASLRKGQVLTIAELQRILHLNYPDKRWWSKLLGFKAWVEKRRAVLNLPTFTIRTPHDTLTILNDSQAAIYNRGMARRGIRRFRRSARRNQAVDQSQLTDEERAAHGRTLERHAKLALAIRKAATMELPVIAPPTRTTPPMLPRQERPNE